MSEWQPIDTAPRDCRDILVYIPETKRECDRVAVGNMMRGCDLVFLDCCTFCEPISNATHWMPKPKAPGVAL